MTDIFGKKCQVIVTELLQESLWDIFDPMDGEFSLQCACEVGIRIISAIESLHNLGFLHKDIKPDNILVKGEEVVLIDMGLASKYEDSEGNHIPERKVKAVGCVIFLS